MIKYIAANDLDRPVLEESIGGSAPRLWQPRKRWIDILLDIVMQVERGERVPLPFKLSQKNRSAAT